MNILQIDTILLKIIYYVDIDDLTALLITNKHLNEKISKYYKNGEIILHDVPLFRTCDNISTYLKHYKSFIFGKDFPDEPLWLFDSETDGKFVEINNKYVKLENVRFVRPRFCNYVSNYEYVPFKGGLYYWSKLNKVQKYLIWCAITGYHPEILLKKMLTTNESFIDLLSELSWHYQKSFVRYYLEIYCIDTRGLINAKCIAYSEIKVELKRYREHHFLQEYVTSSDKKLYLDSYFDWCDYKKDKTFRENIFKLQLLNLVADNGLDSVSSFENLNINSENLLKEIKILDNILDEIDELDITKTNNLKTSNLNYIDHMSINYPPPKEINSCAQQ